MKRIAALSLLILATSSAFAGEVLIPVVFRGPGAFGTQWRTEIVVTNVPVGLPAMVPTTITFHRDNGQNLVIEQHLAPHEVLAIPDAVFDWFSVENGGGIVRVTWDGDESRVMARARIYNVGEQGEYGQSVPGIDTSKLVSDQYLPGVTGVGGNRTNVGVANPTSAPTIVWVELFDTSGLSRGSFATGVPARSFRQFNDIFSYFQAGPLNAAMVRVTSMDTVVYAYASIVRNDTGDATFVTGQ
jgi:hypothetical protein